MPDRLAFTKMQGVGNDFVVVDGRNVEDIDWSTFAIEVCNRHSGIGADGLLVLTETSFADVMMRMYNPDGTPDVCGNGLRCVARYAVEHRVVSTDRLRIGTLAGTRIAEVHRDQDGAITEVTVGMGHPRFDPLLIPMQVAFEPVVDYPLELALGFTLPITALSTGSTHSVTFVSDLPNDAYFQLVSPQVEQHILFPERTSLMWCVVESGNRLAMRIWERGAGETWGCGTGACAAAVAAVLHGYAEPGEPVTIATLGGELVIRWRSGEEIQMTGPAETVFTGHYLLDLAFPIHEIGLSANSDFSI